MRHADGEGVENGGGKAHIDRQDRHPQPDQRIPAEIIRQADHDRHQRDRFFENAEEGSQAHEEQHDDQQKGIFLAPKGFHQPGDDRLQDPALVHHGKGAADQQDEQDDGDHRCTVRAPQHFHGGGEPAPDGVVGFFDEAERIGIDDLPAIIGHAGILPGRDEACQNARHHHQYEKNDDCLDKGFGTDLSS